MSVRVFAPAKINLTLKVGRPRADGLHPVQSVVAFADVGDWIEAEAQPDSPFHIDGPFRKALLEAKGNIVLDAWAALSRTLSRDRHAAVRLEKHLPIASGIGGGSSDAAATLKALNRLWGLGYSEARLIELARGLGSDVPVCVAARAAYMTGVGETFADLALPSLPAVLVNPNKPLATPDVYREFDAMGLGGDFVDRPAPSWGGFEEAVAGVAAIGNDLEAPARTLMPEIGAIVSALRARPGVRHAALSGSGATVFALVESRAEADALAADIAADHAEWWVRATSLGPCA